MVHFGSEWFEKKATCIRRDPGDGLQADRVWVAPQLQVAHPDPSRARRHAAAETTAGSIKLTNHVGDRRPRGATLISHISFDVWHTLVTTNPSHAPMRTGYCGGRHS